MKTECTKEYRSFQALGRGKIVAYFSGGTITSDGGGLLLREVEQRTAILQLFCVRPHILLGVYAVRHYQMSAKNLALMTRVL